MREIKFRAWDKQNKIMHNDFQFIKSGDEGNDWIVFISSKYPLTNHKTNPFMNPCPYFSRQFEIMQYTGLKDKNGTKVYEGDIVLIYDNANTTNKEPHLIEWDERNCCWNIGIDTDYGEVSFRVIGNIHKNPELLEGD